MLLFIRDKEPVTGGRRRLLIMNFVFYIAIGACAFLTDYSVFLIWFLSTRSPYVANILGIVAGIAVSFSLNRSYNFRKIDMPLKRAAKFVIVALFGMAASSAIIWILLGWDMDPRVAKVIAMVLVFMGQFIANARWTFL
jgi:putative flippase GtrA